MKKDIIMVPFHDYKKWIKEGFRTRDSHLFEHFKKSDNVDKILVINRPVSLLEMIVKRKKWKTKIGKVIWKKKRCCLIEIEKNVYCIDFFLFDFIKVAIQGKRWWYEAFNYTTIQENIKEAVQFLNMNNKILFLENPMAVGVIGQIGEDKFVFDAIDNWLYHPQMKKNYELIKKNYGLIEKKANVILTVSESLKDLFSKNKNVYWISNGVDIQRFQKALTTQKREYPVIGYMGKIQDRVDFDLIEKIAKKYNKNKILIIGPIYSQRKRAKKIEKQNKNINFLGDIHYNDLPQMMKEIDIGIIPHKVDKFTESMNPLKIYEYLAAGKQVVTTEVAGTSEFSDYVYIAKNDAEFMKLIEKAMKKYQTEKEMPDNIRNTIKNEHFWEYKVRKILEKI